MQSLTLLVIMGLASYRATQLVVHDSIGDGLRTRLELWHAQRPGSRVRTFFRDLVGCPYCTGWHLSWITYVVYTSAAGQWGSASLWVHAVQAWAVMGIQALANRFDDTRGGA